MTIDPHHPTAKAAGQATRAKAITAVTKAPMTPAQVMQLLASKNIQIAEVAPESGGNWPAGTLFNKDMLGSAFLIMECEEHMVPTFDKKSEELAYLCRCLSLAEAAVKLVAAGVDDALPEVYWLAQRPAVTREIQYIINTVGIDDSGALSLPVARQLVKRVSANGNEYYALAAYFDAPAAADDDNVAAF